MCVCVSLGLPSATPDRRPHNQYECVAAESPANHSTARLSGTSAYSSASYASNVSPRIVHRRNTPCRRAPRGGLGWRHGRPAPVGRAGGRDANASGHTLTTRRNTWHSKWRHTTTISFLFAEVVTVCTKPSQGTCLSWLRARGLHEMLLSGPRGGARSGLRSTPCSRIHSARQSGALYK